MIGFLKRPARALKGLFACDCKVEPEDVFKPFVAMSEKAKELGVCGRCLILSYDCDTPEDINASEVLDGHLSEIGFKRTYAVPGVVLKRGVGTFRKLKDAGAEFMNHGMAEHAERRGGRYWSITFYNEMPMEDVFKDIRLGHEACKDAFGVESDTFRPPHFGLIGAGMMNEIYAELKRLGYRHSSSTCPDALHLRGAAYRAGGLLELPVSPCLEAPGLVFDSWGHIESPDNPRVKDEYAEKLVRACEFYLSRGLPALLNYYADPAHVAGSERYFEALKEIKRMGYSTLGFGDAGRMVRA